MTLLTCFLIPKPFLGLDGVHQHNTLAFLQSLGVEVLLLGDEPGAAEAAQRFGAKHLPELPRNEQGTPLVNASFALASAHATAPHLCYLNADILLPQPQFLDVAKHCLHAYPDALLTGCRMDLDLPDPLSPGQETWSTLRARAKREGVRRYPAAMDYFVFPKGAFADMPAFAIGRPGWDNWMVYAALKANHPVIDLSADLMVIHQNHTYHHIPGGTEAYRNGPESQSNRHLAGGYLHLYNLRDATHHLVKGRLLPRRWKLSLYPAYRWFMHATTRWPRLRAAVRAMIHPLRSLRRDRD
jgi:hypothetical protein